MRFYRVDLLDFYRGTLSARRLALLVRQLPAESATTRALNGGVPPLSRSEHFLADLWALWAKEDHPVRAAIARKARDAKKLMKLKKMQSRYRNQLSDNGIGDSVATDKG